MTGNTAVERDGVGGAATSSAGARDGRADARLHRSAVLVLYVVVPCALLYPLAVSDIPPLVDYPNHLARFHILTSLDTDPVLRSIYEAHWPIVPNLAMDIVALPLVRLLGIYDAGRVVVALAMLAPLLGTIVLHRVLHGRLSPWPLFAGLLAYNWILFWGFLNYLFAAGAAMILFAAWIATEERAGWARTLAFSVATVALFFCHLLGLGIYALLVAAYEFRRWRKTNGAVSLAAPFIVPVALQFVLPTCLWLLSPTSTGGKLLANGPLGHKLMALLSPSVFLGTTADRIGVVVVGLVVIRGLFSGTLRVDARIAYPLTAVIAAAVVMPTWLMGAWGADIRLPLIALCLFVAATEPRIARGWLKTGIAAALVLFAVARSYSIDAEWRVFGRDFAAFRRATTAIEPGASLLVAMGGRPEDLRNKPYWHMAAIAVIERSVFLPTLFADPAKQPIRIAPRLAPLSAKDVTPLPLEVLRESADPARADHWKTAPLDREVNRFWVDWPKRFDYVLYIHGGDPANPVPERLRPVAEGPSFVVYAVRREAPPTGY